MNYRIVPQLCLSLLLLGSGALSTRANPLSEFTIMDLGVTGEVNTEKVTVLFNPKEYTITKSTPWKHHDIQGLDAPDLEFTSGEPYRIQFELFFDRYEEGKSVCEITDKIEKLALVQGDVHRPPLVLLSWGHGLWENQLLEAKTEFVDFLPDGTPVAAIVRTTWSAFVPVPAKPVAPEFFPAVIAAPDAGVKLSVALDANSVQLLHLIDAPGLVLGKEIKINAEGEMMPRFRFAASPYRLQMQFEVDVSKGGIDPRALTEQMNQLMAAKDGHRPPNTLLTWGTGLAFKCILESFALRFTLFLDDGTPVRATMNVTFKEFSPAEEQLKGNPRH